MVFLRHSYFLYVFIDFSVKNIILKYYIVANYYVNNLFNRRVRKMVMDNQNLSEPAPYFISVGNSGAFVAYCNVRYISGGKIVIFDTPSFGDFDRAFIAVPEDAYNITVDVYIATFIGLWYHVCQLYSQSKPQDYYELYGTIFNPYCEKINSLVGVGDGEVMDGIREEGRYRLENHCYRRKIYKCCKCCKCYKYCRCRKR